MIAPKLFSKSPLSVFQLRATAEAMEIAPAAIKPIPSGIFAPDKARIAPKVNRADPTIASSVPIVVRIGLVIEFQFKPTAVAKETAPATMRATPKPTATPVKANNAPMPKSAPPTMLVKLDRVFFISLSRNFQLIVAAVAKETAPAAIKAMPKGTLTPENARNAPMASKKPPRTLVTVVSVLASCVLMPSQLAAMVVTNPTAPRAIKAKPTGIFAPVTTRIVPIASEKPLITAVRPIRAFSRKDLILSTSLWMLSKIESSQSESISSPSKPEPMPPPAPPPAPPLPPLLLEAAVGLITLSSSMPSVAFLSSLAALVASSRAPVAFPAESATPSSAPVPALKSFHVSPMS